MLPQLSYRYYSYPELCSAFGWCSAEHRILPSGESGGGGGGTANTDGINIITYPCITRRVAVPHLGELGEEVLVFVEG